MQEKNMITSYSKYSIKAKVSPKLAQLFSEKTITSTIFKPIVYIKENRTTSFFVPENQIEFFPIVIIDKLKNLVYIINRKGDAIWKYGESKFEKIKRIEYANVTNENTLLLISDETVKEIDIKTHKKIFEARYYAKSVSKTPSDTYLICDAKKSSVLEVDKNNKIIRIFPALNKQPFYATRLLNGNTLVVYNNSNCVIEYSNDLKVVWHFGNESSSELDKPEFALRLNNNNTIICDTNNSRIINVTQSGEVIQALTNTENVNVIHPNNVNITKTGTFLIIYNNNKNFVEVDLNNRALWSCMIKCNTKDSEF